MVGCILVSDAIFVATDKPSIFTITTPLFSAIAAFGLVSRGLSHHLAAHRAAGREEAAETAPRRAPSPSVNSI